MGGRPVFTDLSQQDGAARAINQPKMILFLIM